MTESEAVEPTSRPGVPLWHFGESVTPIHDLLARGGVLAIPTESSYGLAVDPRSQAGVAEIYRVKQRDPVNPLPVVVADLEQAAALGLETDDPSIERLSALWPAPLTLLVPIRENSSIPLPAAAGSDRLGIRIPAHQGLCDLLRELGHALTATSANQSGEPPLLDPEPVAWLLQRRDAMVVDGGRLPGGEPSTVVGWRDGRLEIVRAGRYPRSELLSRASS